MLTQKQHEFRKTGIGGSDAAAVVWLSKFATPLDIYLQKTEDVEQQGNAATTRGDLLEPFVKSLFERHTGWHVDVIKEPQRCSKNPFMIANLDGVIPSENALAEFKTVAYTKDTNSEWGEPGTDEMPKHYLLQVAHYASVMNVDKVYIGALFASEATFSAYIALQQSGTPIHHRKSKVRL